MKKTGKLLSMLLAVVMIMATMALPAFAVDNTFTVDETTPKSTLTVNKYVVVDKDGTIPNETFTFTLTPVAGTEGMTSEGQDVNSGAAVTTNYTTIIFNNTAPTEAGTNATDLSGITASGSNQKYATGTGTISLAGAVFTAPGIYRYLLKETIPDPATTGMIYDRSEFYVDVYVAFATTPTGNLASELSILGMKTFRYKNKDGTPVGELGEKETNKFVNDFGSEMLVISKCVAGNMGDLNKDFTFTLDIAANTKLSTGTTVTAVKANADGTTSPATVTVGTQYTFTLKHDETLTVKGLPVGTSYFVAEDDYSGEGYTTVQVSKANGVEVTPGEVVGGIIVVGGNSEAFTNTRNVTPPTGILLEIAPYAIVVLLAGVAAVLLISKKRRNASK